MTSPFAHLDISEAFRNYMEGAIDRREYVSRRYAEETDAMVVNLRGNDRDRGADHAVPDLRDDGRVK
jgi:hypothetical protein